MPPLIVSRPLRLIAVSDQIGAPERPCRAPAHAPWSACTGASRRLRTTLRIWPPD